MTSRKPQFRTLMAATAAVTFAASSAWADVKIGFNVPLTGFAAADGKSALNGAKLAVAKANAAGGVAGQKIELVVYDDQASPKEAVPSATKMVEKDEVVGAVSAPTQALPVRQRQCSSARKCPTLWPTLFTLTSRWQATICSACLPWAKCRAVAAPSLYKIWVRKMLCWLLSKTTSAKHWQQASKRLPPSSV